MPADMQARPSAAAGHADVERLAFQFWLDRGAPFGTPDIDWFRAEDELKHASGDVQTALTAVARDIGATHGSIAARAANAVSDVWN